jgi:hypothetical protein
VTSEELAYLRRRERIGGVIIGGLGLFLAGLAWHQTPTGEFSVKASFLGPAFAVIGGGLILWPGYRTERRARGDDLEHFTGLQLLTRRWRTVLIAAIFIGIIFTLALRQGWFSPG